LKFYRTLTKF